MKVKDIMHGITMVDKDISILDAAKLMTRKDIGSVLIRDGECIKIVTERDILKKVVARNKDLLLTKISDIMSECSHTIDAEMDIVDAGNELNKHRIRRLPITESGKLVGIVTARDIARSLPYVYAKKVRDYGRRAYGRPER
jgi:CBS domain-containing protein